MGRNLFSLVLVGLVLLGLGTQTARADTAQIDRLWTALHMDETLEIMREEGLQHAMDAAPDLTGRPADDRWHDAVDEIYDMTAMAQIVRSGVSRALADKDLTPILRYYESDAGQNVVALEVSARRAYLAPGVDEAARDAWNRGGKDGAHAGLIRRYVSAGDLIERNVTGALNSNYAFLRAYAETAPDPGDLLDEQLLLAEVMNEEPHLRIDTTEWLYGYLSLAYAPLSDERLAELVEISSSPDGRALNAALFEGFDPMFLELARALGHAAGRAQAVQDL
ncbi:DUF2059 domain-containing protein [Aliiroseovarius crassostreae]|uniref:DUF2059 domain-containing protein n=1 Tax=Aliiroseovarius crassostreae TaxID=154981 RepID=UPI003C7EB197